VAAGPRFLHLQPGLLHVGGGEQVTVQGAFGRQLARPFTDLIIDHLVQLRRANQSADTPPAPSNDD
jgi:hypothetical protein